MNNPFKSDKNKKFWSKVFKVNPIYILIVLFVFTLALFQLSNNNSDISYSGKSSINELINGILENDVSTILVYNDGEVVVNGKHVDFIEYSESILQDLPNRFVKSTQDLLPEKLGAGDFLTSIFYSGSIFDQIRQIFNLRNSVSYDTIFLGDNFAYSISKNGRNKIYTDELNLSNFDRVFQDFQKDVSYRINKVKVLSLNLYAKQLDLQNIQNINAYSDVLLIDNKLFFHKNKNDIKSYVLDWNANVASLPSFLQSEGISFSSKNFQIFTANKPEPFDLSVVTQILLLVMIVFGAFWIFSIYRSMQSGGGMGINQFGQSKAKLFFGSKTKTTFADVAGIEEAKEELEEIVQFLKFPSKFRKMGARIPKGILMVGPPGTGKTLLARAIAGEANVPFFHTSGSEFEEMLVGAGASRVRDLFAKAKKVAPALIFIDEIDAVARKRGTKINTGANEQTLNQILVEMDGFETSDNVIVIAATNRPDVLDPAILRPGRFDRQIRVELPDADGRLEILKVHSKNKPLSNLVNLDNLAKKTVGFSGADLENILNEAAIIAAKKSHNEITLDDLDEAYSKVVLGPAKRSRKRTEKELELTAIHEAGHAVVAWFIPEATPVDKISIISRGSSGGVTMFLPEKDENILTKNKLLADISVSLGGRAAEELFLDDISTGASFDIDKATTIAKNVVQKFGMSKTLGLVRYGDYEDNDYLGYAYSNSKNYSEHTASKIDKEVYDIIMSCYSRAINILKSNKYKVMLIRDFLLTNEVMNRLEFEKLMNS